MDTSEIRSFLNKLPGIRAAYEVKVFRCWRETKDGGDEEVTLTILDRGPESAVSRYSCEVTTEDGRYASGNSSDNVQAAIALVQATRGALNN